MIVKIATEVAAVWYNPTAAVVSIVAGQQYSTQYIVYTCLTVTNRLRLGHHLLFLLQELLPPFLLLFLPFSNNNNNNQGPGIYVYCI